MRGLTLAAAVTGVLLTPTVVAAARDSTAAVKLTAVQVAMTEFKFTLSRKSVPKGAVSFKVVNKGETAHDFKIKGKKTPLYDAGKGGTLRVTFTKAGRYPYVCTVAGHAAAGMKGVLTVR